MIVTELRCPANPSRMLGKVDDPRPTADGNVVELNCDHCRRTARRTRPDVVRVLHRYTVDGTLLDTDVVYVEVDNA